MFQLSILVAYIKKKVINYFYFITIRDTPLDIKGNGRKLGSGQVFFFHFSGHVGQVFFFYLTMWVKIFFSFGHVGQFSFFSPFP